MKNIPLISIISNAVLLIAVVILFVLHFNGNAIKKDKNTPKPLGLKPNSNQPVAYIQLDTILSKYNLYLDLQDDLTKNIKTNEAKISSQMQGIEKEGQDLEYKRQNMLVTSKEYEKKMIELQGRYQRLQQQQMTIQQQLMQQEQNANRRVIESIEEYLEKVKEEGGYSMILGVTYGSVLYAEPEINITNVVLKGLNEEYTKNTE